MRHRRIRLVTTIFGIATPIAVVKVGTLAKMKQADTMLTCPKCGRHTRDSKKDTDVIEHSQEYVCPCSFRTGWWGNLRRVLRATGEAIEKPRLVDEKEVPDAQLYKYPYEKYRGKVTARIEDNSITAVDEKSRENLRKLVVANQMLGFVLVTKFPDTYEERISGAPLVLERGLRARAPLRGSVSWNSTPTTPLYSRS